MVTYKDYEDYFNHLGISEAEANAVIKYMYSLAEIGINVLNETENFNKTVDEINNKYGQNSVLKASSLLPDSTIIERNKKVGGHSA